MSMKLTPHACCLSLHLAGARRRNLHALPLHDLGTAGLMNANGVDHDVLPVTDSSGTEAGRSGAPDPLEQLRRLAWRVPCHSLGHMPAFYGLPPEPQEETMRAARPRPNVRLPSPARPLPDLASACSGFGPDEPQGWAVVRRRQPRVRRPAPDDPEVDAGRQGPQVGEGAGQRRRRMPRACACSPSARKKELSCEELALCPQARRKRAPKTLKGPSQGLSPAQISRASLFAAEVTKSSPPRCRSAAAGRERRLFRAGRSPLTSASALVSVDNASA